MTLENYCSPPEAPVFYPTCDEFADPLEYVEKIRPIASRAGLCKIIPPKVSNAMGGAQRRSSASLKEWRPPFCVNVDEFRFTPRIQRINELEAGTRAKLRFYERLSKLFDSQGIKWKIPTVERESLDLARLHKVCFGRVLTCATIDFLFFICAVVGCQRGRWFRCVLLTEQMGARRSSNELSWCPNRPCSQTALRETTLGLRCLRDRHLWGTSRSIVGHEENIEL